MWLFPPTVQWAWGAGVKQDPQSAPSFTAMPAGCACATAGFLSINLHQLWQGERERQDAAMELSLHPKHSGQPPSEGHRLSFLVAVAGGAWGHFCSGFFPGHCSSLCAARPRARHQLGKMKTASRQGGVMCRMTQTSPHSAVTWPKWQAGTCASWWPPAHRLCSRG